MQNLTRYPLGERHVMLVTHRGSDDNPFYDKDDHTTLLSVGTDPDGDDSHVIIIKGNHTELPDGVHVFEYAGQIKDSAFNNLWRLVEEDQDGAITTSI